jgi:ATP-dependent Zn protease
MASIDAALPAYQAHAFRLTAVHEAGHAVIARSLGIPIYSVHIVPDDESFGSTYSSLPPLQQIVAQGCDAVRPWVLMCLAGPCAAARHDPSSPEEGGHAQDMELVLRMLSTSVRGRAGEPAHDIEVRRAYRAYHREAFKLVNSHWQVIEAVADRLLERLLLFEHEVDEIAGRFRV